MAGVVHIASFSGGKDSTAMLLKMMELGMPIDEVIFCDTGMEFPELYDHMEELKTRFGINITVLYPKKSFLEYFFYHEKTKGKNKGQKGYSWGDFRNRWCTTLLKTQPFRQYVKKKYLGTRIIEYHGIALDESFRAEKNKDRKLCITITYPLIMWGMTEKDCLDYCYSKGLRWGGVYEEFDRLSCWCCPLKNLKELKIIRKRYPNKWQEMIDWDSRTYRSFKPNYSMALLEEKFAKEDSEKLF